MAFFDKLSLREQEINPNQGRHVDTLTLCLCISETYGTNDCPIISLLDELHYDSSH